MYCDSQDLLNFCFTKNISEKVLTQKTLGECGGLVADHRTPNQDVLGLIPIWGTVLRL